MHCTEHALQIETERDVCATLLAQVIKWQRMLLATVDKIAESNAGAVTIKNYLLPESVDLQFRPRKYISMLAPKQYIR